MINNVKQIILEIIPLYISRQHLVHRAIEELRPDLLMLADDVPKEKMIEKHLQAREVFAQYSHVPQSGIWEAEDGEWDYFIHGLGCRIINRISQEPIEWAAPNLSTFLPEWFINWAKWYLTSSETLQDVSVEALMVNIEELIVEGILERSEYPSGGELGIRQGDD